MVVTVLDGATRVTVADVLRHAANVLEDTEWSKRAAVPSGRMVRKRVRRKKLCLIGAIVQARADLALPYTYWPEDELEAIGFARTRLGVMQWQRACWWNQQRTWKGEVVYRLRGRNDDDRDEFVRSLLALIVQEQRQPLMKFWNGEWPENVDEFPSRDEPPPTWRPRPAA
jgi:hypothetical protein